MIGSILAWMLTIFLLIAFAFAGGVKLANNPGMVQEFAQVGLGQWFRYFTGILEVTGAIGLLIPRVRFWAALQIAMVMVGATPCQYHGPAFAGNGTPYSRPLGVGAGAGLAAASAIGATAVRGSDFRMTNG